MELIGFYETEREREVTTIFIYVFLVYFQFGVMDGGPGSHPGLGPPGPDFGPPQQGPGGPGGGGGGAGPGGTSVGPSGPGEVYSESSAAMSGMQRGPSPEFLQQGKGHENHPTLYLPLCKNIY